MPNLSFKGNPQHLMKAVGTATAGIGTAATAAAASSGGIGTALAAIGTQAGAAAAAVAASPALPFVAAGAGVVGVICLVKKAVEDG